MTKNILKSKLTKPLKYKDKLQISIKDQNDSESSHNPKVVGLSPTPPATKFIKKIAFLDFKNFWENGGYFGNSLFLKGKMV